MIITGLLIGAATGILLAKKPRSQKSMKKRHRRNSLKRLSAKKAEQSKMLPAEAEAAHQQKVSLGAMVLLGLGAVTTPVIGWVGVPLLIYNYAYMMRKIRDSFKNKGSLTVITFDALTVSFAIILGFFFTAALLFTALFTTNRLIARTERQAQTDFSRIFGELAETVWLLQDGVEVELPLEDLNAGDVIVARAGDMIPVDGKIVAGEGTVDQCLLTGEAQPVEKKVDDNVLTSTLLIAGSLQIRVERQGAETITGQIAQTLENAADFKHHIQSRGEEIVEKGASRTMLASILTLPLIGLNHAIALSYSGFGYQMRMAAPLMVLNYLRVASRNGILIKDGRALDTLKQIDTVVFDKTGTLTEEVPQVNDVVACDGFTAEQVLQYAASAEQRQKHPIARAITSHAQQKNVQLLEITNTDYAIGHGLKVSLSGGEPTTSKPQTVLIGSRRFVENSGIDVPDDIKAMQEEAGDKGYSIVYIATETAVLVGAIELRPSLRPQARNAIKALHEQGITLYIISGDQEQPTRHLAKNLGIDHYFAETLPEGKAQHIADLQAAGHKVCFIGDGINDSVALQKADVSVSLHGAATIAQDTADIVLMTPDLMHLPDLLKISDDLHKRMNRSEMLNNLSGAACVSGVMVLGMGIGGAILLYSGGLLANIGHAMLPLLTHPESDGKQLPPQPQSNQQS